MSFVIVAPEALMSVASEVAGIGSALNAANAAAAAPTTGVLAAAADEVSAAMAALFGAHAQEYQRLSAQAAGFHAQFVQALNAGVNSYASAEAANASPLQAVEQQVLGLINGPAQTLLGRPLIGNGADGAPGTGQPGGPAGCCGVMAATAGRVWPVWAGPVVAPNSHPPAPPCRRPRRPAAAPEPTVADQPGGTTVAAGHPHGRAGAAVATVAVQQPAGPAVLSRPAVGAITDQRAPKNPLEASVDRGQQVLFHALRRRDVDRLRSRISPAGTRQRLHELGVKRRHLGAHRLIRLTMRPKQRRDCRGNLISTRGQHRGGRRQRRGVGLRQCRPDAR